MKTSRPRPTELSATSNTKADLRILPIANSEYAFGSAKINCHKTTFACRCIGVEAISMSDRWIEAEFEAIFREHYQRIVRVIRRVLKSDFEAEEVCAEVF